MNKIKFVDVIDINPHRKLEKGELSPYVPMGNLGEGKRTIQDIDFREYKNSGSKFVNGDTLLARITPCLENGKTAFVDKLKGNQVAHGSTEFIVLRGKEGITDNLFVYYLVRSTNFRNYAIKSMTGSSGRQRVQIAAIENYEFELPSLEEQIRIANSLGYLDKKIEHNQRMNETLEEIARAIFKSWFVDFDPVRAKMAGKPYPLPDEVMALFPDELVESELGLIPKGWEVKSVENVAYVIDCLHSKKPSQISQGKLLLQVFNIGKKGRLDLSEKFYISDEDYNTWIRRFEASSYDMIISKTGRVGAVAQIPKGFKAALGRNLVGIRARKKIINETFLRDLMLSEFMEDEIYRKTSLGTILRSIHVKHISMLKLVQPQKDLQRIYKSLINPIHDKINLNIFCNDVLTINRDNLLLYFFSNNE